MPACSCPHCKTRLWVKDNQLNIAQGFVVCSHCEGLFKAKDHVVKNGDRFQSATLPNAVTDVRLVHDMGKAVRERNVLSRHEIADLLDNGSKVAALKAQVQQKKQGGFNWTVASFVAMGVLVMQLFYIILMS
ncbi:MJ0042-type zinc finger domain-containing protein [Neisseria sp.]|uniref:MJ0042-type zinc finger domain-containing protein n=1 Tax=Neisseria sp. TaxID=192066 RepID=UPI0035A0F2AF